LALYKFADAIRNGQPLSLFGDGTARRDFTHVSDICEGFIAAMRKDAAVGECINLGHNQPIGIREMIEQLESALGKPAIIEPLPSRPEDMRITCAKLDKAREILNWESKIDFTDGVQTFVRWFLKERSEAGLQAENS
jgi:UDP-glucuronate 4-epimerase